MRRELTGTCHSTDVAACNLEGCNIAVADFDLLDSRANLVDDAAEFMTEDVSFVHLNHRAVKKMKVAATEGAAGDSQNNVRVLQNSWFRDINYV